MASDLTLDSRATTSISRVAFALAVLFVSLRFYTRRRLKIQIGWDDWWILIGLLMTFLTYGLLLWSALVDRNVVKLISKAHENHSTHTFDLKPHVTLLKLYFVISILYFTLVMAIKVSILLMYRRIFSVDSLFRIHSLLLGVAVLAFWFAASITRIFMCGPVGYMWIGLDLEKHCLSYHRFWVAVGVIDIIIDTLILALPVRMIQKIQLSPKQKASITFLFLLGGFVVITGILRVIYFDRLNLPGPSCFQATFWSEVHIAAGIICACIPTLRPLFARTPLFNSKSTSAFPIREHHYHIGRPQLTSGISSNHCTSDAPNIVNGVERPSFSKPWVCHDIRVANPRAGKVWLRDSRLA